MKFLINKKLATRIGTIMTIIILIGMSLLWIIVSANAASMVKEDITNQMTDAVESRAAIINGYVSSVEEYVTAFALSNEVREFLLHPEDPDLKNKAQKYTEDFAAVKNVFEGLYIATPDTHVLTHTSQEAIGITTRTGESLKTFQDTILSVHKLTNLGIMKSPGTGSMILSMYCPIFDDQKCIGYVGAGVYASHLTDALMNLSIEGLPDSKYVFLNVDTGVYLYHHDETLLNTETTDDGYREIIRKIQADGDTEANTYSYRDENGVRQLVVYKYLSDRNWVFMVCNDAAKVYGAVKIVRISVGILCAIVAAAIILITLVILHREGKELMTVEHAISQLRDLNLTVDKELENFYDRSDEIGMIAQTTHHVCTRLRKTIDDVGRILGEIADGNLTVDVARNESYYIGDFKTLFESLNSIHSHLMNMIRDISHVANQVDTSADQVAASSQVLSKGTTEQAVSLDGLVSNVTAITSQIRTNSARCNDASALVDKATGYTVEANAKMEQLMTATKNIDTSSAQIVTVIKTIEDIAFRTNILALNASVEAARVGDLGKGFAVVAESVRDLAAKSTEAAQNSNELINHSIEDVKTGTESTNLAVSAMKIISDCIQTIKTLMDEISSASSQQSQMIVLVEDGIKEISNVVQTNSATAAESATVSKELSDQARTLNSLISRFQLK